ncbi:MAG: MDR family MFS transporter [Vicinamibacterales bacterium]
MSDAVRSRAQAERLITSYAHLDDRQRMATVGGMMLTLLLAAMDQTIVGTAMPRVVASLDGFDRYPWVTTSYLLTSTISVPVFAKLSDLFGRKWLYLTGLIVFVVSSWLCGASGNVPLPLDGMNQLILFRGLQGIGGGAVMGLTFTIIGDLFAPAERGRYQGMFGAVFGLASIVGPLTGGWVTDHLSWRWAFYINAPLGILAASVLYRTFPHVEPHGTKRTIDWLGLVSLAGWIVPLLLALSRVTADGWSHPTVIALLTAAAASFAVFVWAEWHAEEPLMPPSLFGIRTIALASCGVFVLGMSLFGMFVYLPLFLQGVLGMSAAASGMLFVPMIFAMISASVVSGQLVSRTGRYKYLSIGGAVLATTGMLLLARLGASGNASVIVWCLVVAGLGFGVAQPVYSLVVQNAAPRAQLGAATATSQFFRSIGSTIGVALFGTLLLGVYHQRLTTALPPGTPAAVRQLVDNPLQMNGEHAASMPALPAGALAPEVSAAVRASLAAGMQRVFDLASIVMALSIALNLLLPELPLRTRAEHVMAAAEPA